MLLLSPLHHGSGKRRKQEKMASQVLASSLHLSACLLSVPLALGNVRCEEVPAAFNVFGSVKSKRSGKALHGAVVSAVDSAASCRGLPERIEDSVSYTPAVRSMTVHDGTFGLDVGMLPNASSHIVLCVYHGGVYSHFRHEAAHNAFYELEIDDHPRNGFRQEHTTGSNDFQTSNPLENLDRRIAWHDVLLFSIGISIAVMLAHILGGELETKNDHQANTNIVHFVGLLIQTDTNHVANVLTNFKYSKSEDTANKERKRLLEETALCRENIEHPVVFWGAFPDGCEQLVSQAQSSTVGSSLD